MPNYALGKIYKLTHPDTDDIYIGSTAQKYLSMRLVGHKASYKSWKNGKTHYRYSFKLFELGADDVKIELVECCPCTCKEELHKKEGEHIKETKCVNTFVAGRTRKEYNKEWFEANKEKMTKYREANKEKRAKQWKEWYKANKEELAKKKKAKLSQKITCECGSVVCKGALTRHKRSKKHKDFIEATD